MRLITFSDNGEKRIGCVVGNDVVDLNFAYLALLEGQGNIRANALAQAIVPSDMVGLLQGGDESIAAAKQAVEFILSSSLRDHPKLVKRFSDIRLEAPVLNPSKIICVGHNYREHILEMKRELPPFPVVFAKFSNTIVSPQDPVPFYSISEQLDYEAEFAFVIGRRAKNISREKALDYVAGYTIANDVTYRDLQRRTLQWLQGKSVDGTLPLGPWLVTTDEIPNPAGLEIFLTVNGEERQRSNTRNLVFDVKYLVEFLSGIMTLEPGDIVLTGTPGGVGAAMNPQTFLKDGDVVRIAVEQIGVLENRIQNVEREV